jgi:hypothetical protein
LSNADNSELEAGLLKMVYQKSCITYTHREDYNKHRSERTGSLLEQRISSVGIDLRKGEKLYCTSFQVNMDAKVNKMKITAPSSCVILGVNLIFGHFKSC